MSLQSTNSTSENATESSNSTDDSYDSQAFEDNLYYDFAYELMIDEIEAELSGNDTSGYESLQSGDYDNYEIIVSSLQAVEVVEVDGYEIDANYDDSYDTYALAKVSYFTVAELKSLKENGILLGLWSWDEISQEIENKTTKWGHEVENKTHHWESEVETKVI